MKKSWSYVALLAALAVGTASAAGTTAGTEIKNQAEIIYTPEGSTTPVDPIKSNEVTTTVLPNPSFTILPNDEGAAGPTFPTQNANLQKVLRPCDTAVFLYTLTNTGNVPNESYTLTTSIGGTPAIDPATVKYYPLSADTTGANGAPDGTLDAAEIAKATPIPNNVISGVGIEQKVQFFQVYTVPCLDKNPNLQDGSQVGADPIGTRNPQTDPKLEPAHDLSDPTKPYTQPKDDDNFNTVTIKRDDNGVIGPKNDADGNGTPTTPAYPSKDTTPVTITPTADDKQVANAVTSTTSVTFTNTIQNTGKRDDTFTITTSPANFPAGTTVTVHAVNPDGTVGAVITQTDKLAPGATQDVYVVVTFPAGSGSQVPDPTKDPTVTVTITSQNDSTKSDPTKDIVRFPSLVFGDVDPTKPSDAPKDTQQPAIPANPDPKDPTAVNVDPATCTNTTNAYLTVGVKNNGQYADSYNISGTTDITLASTGQKQTVTVTYYNDANGNGKIDAGETALPVVSSNPQVQSTGTIQPGETMRLVAVIPVPCDAAKNTYTVNQSVVSPTTGVTGTDTNDTVKVGASPVAAPTKAVDLAKALPGQELTYTIVGKNTSNANITKAMVCDIVPANTTFVSFVATSDQAGQILYSNDGGTNWSTTASAPAAGQKICAAVNTNGDSTISVADILAPGKSINVTYKVKVN